jgi:hypothetical protein
MGPQLPSLDLIGFSAATTAGWRCPLQASVALVAAPPFLSPLIQKDTFLYNLFNQLSHTLCMKTDKMITGTIEKENFNTAKVNFKGRHSWHRTGPKARRILKES